ncbi:MAG TPA: metallophosphoesterase [Thermoanaerobaculia bacterium]|nr:metallophosphoesterase [Thermoanaerobaculia bacterium]
MAEISNRRMGLVLFIAALWVAWPAMAQEAPPAPPAGTFLSISDIHFDPFYDPKLVPQLGKADVEAWKGIFEGSQVTAWSTYGSDTNFPLLRSTLAALQSAAPKPDFILISGDFLGHGFQQSFDKAFPDTGSTAAFESFVRKTIGFVTAQLREAFPEVPIYPALGNNDSYCGDYQIDPAGPFLAALQGIWRPLLGSAPGTFDETFPLGGFYSVPHPTVPKQRIVVLNSVFFSRKYKNACGSVGDPASLELGWLAYTLQRAALAGETVLIVEHIPPGIDVFSTLQATGPCQTNPVPLWQANALSTYQQILAAAPGTVAASFAGHTHIDDFRLPAGGGFVHGTPAVSPVYNNNPGFQVFTYDRASGALADFRTIYLDVSGGDNTPWAVEYDFQQSFGQTAYNATTLQTVQQAIVADPVTRGNFFTFYPVRSQKGSIDPQSWKAYACGITSSTPADFASCYCPQ